ncbi:hypothetical protein GF386_01415 [Candidatus Pacearchaeota archaeon]|nr:hypothetical protein [Candidatus Pacearchaeota archaeon]
MNAQEETCIMKKRGQVTVFVVVGIVVVAAVGLGIYLTSVSPGEEDRAYFESGEVASLMNNVKNSIFSCMEQNGRNALIVIGVQGGYYNPPQDYFDLGWAIIPYYYDKGRFLMPSDSVIEKELASYVDDNLGLCLDRLDFEGFDLDYESSRTTASIEQGQVTYTIDMPITVKRENKRMVLQLAENPVSVTSSLSEILEVADYITESHKEDPEMVCISCVADMAEERDLYVDMLDFDEESTTLVVISENRTSEEPYIFEFLNRYPV